MQDPVDKKKEILTQILREPHRFLIKASSDPEDYLETQEIESLLKDEFQFYESVAEAKHKEEVLGRLISIIKQWSFIIAKSKFPESIAQQIEAKLYTFGSYRLNVNTNDADIDTVCVVPNFINREEHFFIDLYEILKTTAKVNEINCIKNAAVPILKMVFDGIHIDMCFAQLDMERIDDGLNLNDNNLLMNLDEKSCKSLNGRRVADMILNSVPNKETFRQTLRFIKLWARNHGIHSNVMGYLGGVTWAILVAKICQMFPNYQPSRLVEKFFHYYESWDWQKIPVKIEEIVEEKHKPKHLEQWTEADMEKNLMSIITPAFPCMNSSHSVTHASLNVLKNMLREGNGIIKDIKAKKLQWRDLFKKIDFFGMYRNFIEIDIVGSVSEEFKLWVGFVESKIRKLANNFQWQKIDDTRNYVDILDFHLFPKGYFKQDKEYPFSRAFFYGLKLKKEYASEFLGFKFDYFSVPIARFFNHIFEEAFKEDKGDFKQGAKINLRVFKVKKSEIDEVGYLREEDPSLVNPHIINATVPVNNTSSVATNNNGTTNNAVNGNNNGNGNSVFNGLNNGHNNNGVHNGGSYANSNNNTNNKNDLKRGSTEILPEPLLRKKVFREEDKSESARIRPMNNKPQEKGPENYLDSLFN